MKKSSFMMKQTKEVASWLCITFLLLVATMNNNVYGNAVALSTIAVDQAASTVTFTMTWQNSWRIAAATAPYNWDAVWVFVKFRDCSADPITTQFTHGAISTTVGNHNYDVNGDGAQVEPTTCGGIGVATITVPGIDADGKGVMLRRTSVGAGTVTETVRLNVTDLPASGTLDVRVFAIEMVFCEGGTTSGYNHYVGDGDGSQASFYSFSTISGGKTGLQITSENAQNVYLSDGGTWALTASFQKGWNPFYIMKYEISQGQYTDFLNTLHSNGATNRFPGSFGSYRNRISQSVNPPPQVYTCDRPDRACNFLGWADVSAYLDWAALRPLTEMEYEKAGRGFSAKQVFEYAWGNTTITAATTLSGAEDGTETITTANANVAANNNTAWTNGDAGLGPLRCGIFAQAATTRATSGSGYFGALDLSGNVQEFYISNNCGTSGNESASGVTWGDGALDANANHNVASGNWPPYNVSGQRVMRRGGCWWNNVAATQTSSSAELQLSMRWNNTCDNCARGIFSIIRDQYVGGRGGR